MTIVRLPPVLMIQLKRFLPVNGGQFWDKSDTPVIFPLKNLDLTRYVPVRQPTGNEDLDDPRTQIGPFKYDLYGVSNHMGTLSSGHCECAFLPRATSSRLPADSRHGLRQEQRSLVLLRGLACHERDGAGRRQQTRVHSVSATQLFEHSGCKANSRRFYKRVQA